MGFLRISHWAVPAVGCRVPVTDLPASTVDLESRVHRFSLWVSRWEEIKVLRPVPSSTDCWGVLAVLKGTPLEPYVPIVSGESFSHALHGRVEVLVRELGRPPSVNLHMNQHLYPCQNLNKSCSLADEAVCRPCVAVPACYAPGNLPAEVAPVAGLVITAWAEGRYVVVVGNGEFSVH